MAKAKTDKVKVIVIPKTDNAYEENYVKVNGKIIPFEIPVLVSENDIKAIERIKEARRVDSNRINVRELMDSLKISQEKANQLARSGEIENSKIRYVNKYIVQRIS